MRIFRVWREARKLADQHAAEERADKIRLDLAKKFNHLYAYTSDPGRWMCPDCNKVHESTKNSVFTGLQYPACCRHPEGHRQYHEAACMPLNCKPIPSPRPPYSWREREPVPPDMPVPPSPNDFQSELMLKQANLLTRCCGVTVYGDELASSATVCRLAELYLKIAAYTGGTK